MLARAGDGARQHDKKVTAAAARQGAARIPPSPAVAFGDPRGHGLLCPMAESDATRRGARHREPSDPSSLDWTRQHVPRSQTRVPTVLPGLLHVTSVIHR